jgi:hypothetical protein
MDRVKLWRSIKISALKLSMGDSQLRSTLATLLEQYFSSLPEEEKRVTLNIPTEKGTISVPRGEIPRRFAEDPAFADAYIRYLARLASAE